MNEAPIILCERCGRLMFRVDAVTLPLEWKNESRPDDPPLARDVLVCDHCSAVMREGGRWQIERPS